jgi:hypothetical protein
VTDRVQFDLSAAITAAIDAGLERHRPDYAPSGNLGASELGDPCLRKLVYKYRKTPQARPEPRMRRVWDAGHTWEARIIDWLRLAGFMVADRSSTTGKQIRFDTADGRITGRVDGVVMTGPVALPYPLLLELKALGDRSWNDIARHGLAAAKEIYFAQCHLAAGYLDLEHILFGAFKKSDESLLWLVLPYDSREAQRVSDRGVDVIRFGEDPNGPLPPRIASSKDYYMCRMCGFSEICWE